MGHVFPLRPVRGHDDWSIDARLPFGREEILDVLIALVQASGVAEKWSVPERFSFRFENATGLRARGESMTMAAVLAVLDCMTGFGRSLLRAATAVVQLESGGELKPVGDILAKLEAAKRECGQLSLVICAPGSEIDRSSASEMWEVQSLADLASHLHASGLLATLLDAVGPLDKRESASALERLKWLDRGHHYREAADLGDRVFHCGFAEPVDSAVLTESARLYAVACRYHGRFSDAVRVGQEVYDRIKALGTIGCDDEEADAAAEFAASLFNAHRFAEIVTLLSDWAGRAVSEPRRFRPLTRVKVWNTLGRALAIIAKPGWDELFARSLVLNGRLADRGNLERTYHYLIHARLRHGDTAGARQALSEMRVSHERGDEIPWKPFLYANLARLESRIWTDSTLEARLAAGEKPYAAWLYLQATARQPTREPEDALLRLEAAVSLLRQEAGGNEGNICNLFAALLNLLSASRSENVDLWPTAATEARNFLTTAPDHRAYYGPKVDALPATCDAVAVETLLKLVPYF